MQTPNDQYTDIPHPTATFADASDLDVTPARSGFRSLVEEVLAESGREANRELRRKRNQLSRRREALARLPVQDRARRRERAQQAMQQERRRQRAAQRMRTQEVAAILGDAHLTPVLPVRNSGGRPALVRSLATSQELVPVGGAWRPFNLSFLLLVLAATLLIPAAVLGSAPQAIELGFQKQRVEVSQPVRSEVTPIDVVAVANQDLSQAAVNDDTELQSTSRPREHRRSRRHNPAPQAPAVAPAPDSTPPALHLELDGDNIFNRGSD